MMSRVLIFFLFLTHPLLISTAAASPKLLKAIPLSETAIQLRFDAPLETETAEDSTNYRITEDVGIEYVMQDPRLNRVLLVITSPLASEHRYRVTFRDSEDGVSFTLPAVNEITVGTSESVTFVGGAQDTSLIVNKERKTWNNNAGGEPTLVCGPGGGIFFIAFDLFEPFADMGIRDPSQIIEAKVQLYVERCDPDTESSVLFRRVLLPWREGRGVSESAEDNELTYNSALHRNLRWNRAPAQAMLAGIDGDTASDYNGSEDIAHRIDGTCAVSGAEQWITVSSDLFTDAVRFWVANPDYNYGYLFALSEGSAPITFASKETPKETHRPVLTIRYRTAPGTESRE